MTVQPDGGQTRDPTGSHVFFTLGSLRSSKHACLKTALPTLQAYLHLAEMIFFLCVSENGTFSEPF